MKILHSSEQIRILLNYLSEFFQIDSQLSLTTYETHLIVRVKIQLRLPVITGNLNQGSWLAKIANRL
jgi:hypothetical protein